MVASRRPFSTNPMGGDTIGPFPIEVCNMPTKRIGIHAGAPNAEAVLDLIRRSEAAGVQAAWLTTGGAGLDRLDALRRRRRTDRQYPVWHIHSADLPSPPDRGGATGSGNRPTGSRASASGSWTQPPANDALDVRLQLAGAADQSARVFADPAGACCTKVPLTTMVGNIRLTPASRGRSAFR